MVYFAGNYLYIETSNRAENDDAIIQTKSLVGGMTSCLEFWYHAKGPHIGQLHAYVVNNPGSTSQDIKPVFNCKNILYLINFYLYQLYFRSF